MGKEPRSVLTPSRNDLARSEQKAEHDRKRKPPVVSLLKKKKKSHKSTANNFHPTARVWASHLSHPH